MRADAHTVVIGCGEAGLLTGIRLAQAGVPFTIVEKSTGPGGTWWDNRYPGARVDIGSHFYCYSFEPSDHWAEYFAQQPELKEYFARVLDDYDIRPHCRFGTEVTEAAYDEATGRWAVTVRTADGATEVIDARFVISAVGALNQPKLPDIPGMDDFAGPSFHSARWDPDVDWKGSRFALVGAGASGFQIAPTIADEVEHLTIFQRTAQWMFPNAKYHEQVPAGDTWAMRHLPFYGRWFRFLTFYPAAGLSMDRNRIDPEWDDDGRSISAGNAQTREMFGGWIASQLQDRPDLLEVCIPHYPPSAKRMLQDNGSWLTCLKKPNVELVRTGIERIVPEGIVTTDGTLHEADIICYATGFRHNDFLWPMEITGRDGVRLRDQWGDEPTAYLGITVPELPEPVLPLRPRHQPGPRRQPHLPVGVPGQLHPERDPRGPRHRSPRPGTEGRGGRHLRPPLPGRDQPDGVGALVGAALPLQEPRGQGLDPLAVADPDLLGLDPGRRARRLRVRLTGQPGRDPRRS